MSNWLFSYGSNSAVQLRARVQNPLLQSYPAIANGWERIFCWESERWGGTGVASLTEVEGAQCLGAAALLSSEELARLDAFELPAYRRTEISIVVFRDDREEVVQAIAYRAINQKWISPPSEQYLTAIHHMLREQWGIRKPVIPIAVNGLFPVSKPSSMVCCNCHAEVQVVENTEELKLFKITEWVHPGPHRLTLQSLCVEVNTMLDPEHCWVMPRTINEITSKFAGIGIYSSAQLAARLASEEDPFRTDVSVGVGCPLNEHVLNIFRILLQIK